MKGFIINYELNRDFSESQDNLESMVFYGVLEDGKNFIWKQTHPYIIAFLDTALPEKYKKKVWKQLERIFTDYRKNSLWGYFFNDQTTFNELQKSYPDYDYFESDVLPEEQFLMSKHIRGTVDFLSPPEKTEENVVYFTDPKVRAVKELFIPPVRVLSLDIETGVESDEIYAIGLCGDGLRRVLLQRQDLSQNNSVSHDWGEMVIYPSEVELLKAFQELIEEYNPHVFIGWNVMGFDFNFIIRKFMEHQIPIIWGVGKSPVISFKNDKGRPPLIVKIPGRSIVEGMDLVKCLYDPLPNYKLNTAAEYILNEKKTIEKEGSEKVAEIERLYREDKEELARYNFYDAELVYKIFNTLKGIDFIFNASVLSGTIPEKIFNPHDVMDRFYLPLLHKNKIAAYKRISTQIQINSPSTPQEFSGGFHKDVAIVEFKDIFLTVIMAYRIDPLGMIRAQIDKEHSSVVPNGVYFHDHDHILPGIIKNLFDLRLEAQKLSIAVLVSAIENALQQISTCFGSAYSRYFLPGLYDVLETNVRLVMESIVNRLGNSKNQVIFYDNVSLAVALGEPFEEFSLCLLELIEKGFFRDLFPSLENKDHYLFKVKRQLYFKEFFFPRQIPILKNKSEFQYWALDSQNIFLKHSTRKFSPDLVGNIYDQVIYHLLQKKDIESYLRNFKKDLLSGKLDTGLIYRKKLSKKPSEYVGSSHIPPQAVAAMKAKENFEGTHFFQRQIEYCQTVNGPEPVQALHSELDYQHYLEKEFIPALEEILKHSDREDLILFLKNQDHQLSLF